jgi:glycosyltransferase involved in cell wall biosynthesis
MTAIGKVSIVIPTYNRGYIIRDALDSIFKQTYKHFELIIVDDGSTDNTHEIVRSVVSKDVRYIKHETNRGCSAAYNTGMQAASGQLIGFLDSDDVWKTDYLERQTDFFARHPDVDAVFTDTEIKGEGINIESLISLMHHFPALLGSERDMREYILDRRAMYLCILEEIPVKPSALVFKSDLVTQYGGFNEEWPSGTDWDLLLRFSRSCTFGYIDARLVTQRRTSDATHQKFREQDQLFLLNVFLNERKRLLNDKEALILVNRSICSRYNDLGSIFLHSGRQKESIVAYLRGFKENYDFLMIVRAIYACLPPTLRSVITQRLRRTKGPPAHA